MKKIQNHSMADVLLETRQKKVKSKFFEQVDSVINWKPIIKIIDKSYNKSTLVGRPHKERISLFKICLIQTWYGLSDYEVEDRINDSISMGTFIGLSVDECCPDHSTISRFRSMMNKNNVYEKLLKEINNQLEKHQVLVKTGVIVDASIIETPNSPKNKPKYILAEDRKEDEREEEDIKKEKEEKQYQRVHHQSVDTEASWIKKGKKSIFGFKKHVACEKEGLILSVVTTSANVNDTRMLGELLSKIELKSGIAIYADKGYSSEKNRKIIEKKRCKSRIMYKKPKNKNLPDRMHLVNKKISKERWKIERTFGSCKSWFKSGVARYKGLGKMHTQNLIEAMAYNLYRMPNIIIKNGC